MPKLLYILSAGHSGSTLLDILAGTVPGIFSTGECEWFPWQLYRNGGVCELGQDVCSCGEKFSECETWVKVVTALSQKVGYDVYGDPFRFKIKIFSNQGYNKDSTFSERLFKASCIRFMQFYYPIYLRNFFSHLARKEVNNSWFLFDTISEKIGARCIVDSSKDIMRMKFLHEKRPNDVYAVLLIRDILGVSASAVKRGGDPLVEARDWFNLYTRIFRILRKTDNLKIINVLYEELAENPQKIRNKIARFLDINAPKQPVRIDTREHHLVAGNPMRYTGKISIKYDDSWKKVLEGDIIDKINTIKVKFAPILKELQKMSWDDL